MGVLTCDWTISCFVSPSAWAVPGHSDLHRLGAPRPGGLRHPAVLFFLLLALDLRGGHLLLDVQAWRLPGQHLCNAQIHMHKPQPTVCFWWVWCKTLMWSCHRPVKIMIYHRVKLPDKFIFTKQLLRFSKNHKLVKSTLKQQLHWDCWRSWGPLRFFSLKFQKNPLWYTHGTQWYEHLASKEPSIRHGSIRRELKFHHVLLFEVGT